MKNFEIKFYTSAQTYINLSSIKNSNQEINSGRILIRDNENIIFDKFYSSILQGVNIFLYCINDFIEFKSVEFGISEIINEDYDSEDLCLMKFEENTITKNEIGLSFSNKKININKNLFFVSFFNELVDFYSINRHNEISADERKININRLLFYAEKMNIKL